MSSPERQPRPERAHKPSEQWLIDRYGHILDKLFILKEFDIWLVRAASVFEQSNVDIRRQFEQDKEEVGKWLENLHELPTVSEQDVFSVVSEGIRYLNQPSHQRSLLAKMYVAIGLADAFIEYHNRGHWEPWLYRKFEAALKANQELNASTYLFAAFQARWRFLRGRLVGVEEVDRHFPAATSLTTTEAARRDLSIQAVAYAYRELVTRDHIDSQLGMVKLAEAQFIEASPTSPGSGYPDTMMYLAPFHTPSTRKMRQGSSIGVPHPEHHLLIRRTLNILFGVDGKVDSRFNNLGIKAQTEITSNRHFLFISLSPVGKPVVPAYVSFGHDYDLTDESIKNRAAFDSLSFWMAVKIARTLGGTFQKLDELEDIGDAGRSLEDLRMYRDRKKNRAVELRILRYLEFIKQPLATIDGEKQSILSLATTESQAIFGSHEWTEEEIEDHLFYTVRALLMSHTDEYGYDLRDETQINRLYEDHLFESVLSFDDKVQLALFIFHSKNKALGITLSHEERLLLNARLTNPNQELPLELEERMAMAVRPHMQLRFETIRDRHLPPTLLDDEPGSVVYPEE